MGGLPTLILSVTALDLLVHVLLHLTLENAGSGGLVEASCLQDVCRVDPVILAAAHDMFFEVGAELEFVDGNLQGSVLLRSIKQRDKDEGLLSVHTLLYVAL
jgi:hypothetical protein